MAELAITGGPPVESGGLETEWPIFDDERDALLGVLESGRWCSDSSYFEESRSAVERFEGRFARYVGTEYATAVPNGTQALQLAFSAIGVQPGDEVIVPAVTFVASASAAVRENAVPRFVDVDPETYQLDPTAVEAAITEQTVALEAVHYGGYPADMDRLTEIADEHGLFLIEDAAEAHGTEWRGERVGSIGDVGCFSLQQGKPLTCGEGGVLTYDDDRLAERIYASANLGRSPHGDRYEHHVPAGNYRLSEFLGALLNEQLDRLPAQTARRAEHGALLREAIADLDGLRPLAADPRITQRGYYFLFLRYAAEAWNDVHRDQFLAALEAEGIPCSTAHNDPVYRLPAFAEIDPRLLHGVDVDYAQTFCPEAERIYESEAVALPKDVLLERASVEAVIEALEKLRANDHALERWATASDQTERD